jgi:23S rRNA (pseudouridine1915-N3)-methyltransferase
MRQAGPKLTVIAVGKARRGPIVDLWAEYAGRSGWPIALIEVEAAKGLTGARLKTAEADLLEAKIPDGARLVALDERGDAPTSGAFADLLGRWRDEAVRDIAFVVGGADGLARPLVDRADTVLAFGPMTWPHQLVRVMLAEQLYRAQTILTGHPYHRA